MNRHKKEVTQGRSFTLINISVFLLVCHYLCMKYYLQDCFL